MKILHTSDWHFGAWLGDKENSRLPEQEAFVDELCGICDNEEVDLVVVAGDVFDSYMPSAAAETLFFNAMERLGGNRAVVVIAGNHDDPGRITAARTMLAKHGVVVLGTPLDEPVELVGKGFSVKRLCACCMEIAFDNGETAVVAAMPYPSEKRLNMRLTGDDNFNEEDLQKSYSEKVGGLFGEMAAYFRDDTVNVAVAHIYVRGGQMSAGTERDISLGGGFAVAAEDLPGNADYIALGHLHRPQKIGNAVYSGSPIAYGVNESYYSKCVYIAEIVKNEKQRVIKSVFLKRLKPLEVWTVESADEAISECEKNADRDCFVYISIKSERPLLQNEIKAMRAAKKDIIRIETAIGSDEEIDKSVVFSEKSIFEEFADFYARERKAQPPKEIAALFQEIILAAHEEADTE